MNKRIINKVSFLGLSIYKQVRLYEKKITTSEYKINYKYAGLFALSKNEKFEYDYVTLVEFDRWEILAIETLYTAIYMLFFMNCIEIIFYEDQIYYFGKKIKKRSNFYLKAIENSNLKNKFLLKLYAVIKENEIYFQKENTLKKSIHNIIDIYINSSQVKKSHKKFVVNVLGRIASNNMWLESKLEPKKLFFLNNYSFNLPQEIKEEIIKEYKELKNSIIASKKENKMLVKFSRKLADDISKDLSNRENNN